MIRDEAQFSLSQLVDLFSFPTFFKVAFLLQFQYNEVSEEQSTSSEKLVLIQNKAALRTSIIPNYIVCLPLLLFSWQDTGGL